MILTVCAPPTCCTGEFPGAEVWWIIRSRSESETDTVLMRILSERLQLGIDTIVTCDNGIAALDQIALAKELGLTVVVTDHHEVVRRADGSEQLPCADAVVNPKQDGCSYPFKSICGGVVAYKLVQVLFERFGIPETEWEQMLEFAAIAAVGDVMPLQDENRILVRRGLRQIACTKSAGLRAFGGSL